MKRTIAADASMSGDMLLLVQYLRDDLGFNPWFTFEMRPGSPFFLPCRVVCEAYPCIGQTEDTTEYRYEVWWNDNIAERLDQVMYRALSGLVESVNIADRANYRPQS